MERVRERVSQFIDRSQLRRVDRRNKAILAGFGLPMFVISIYAQLSGSNLFPELWVELIIITVLGLLYRWAIQKQSLDLRLGLVYTAVGILVSLPLLIVGTLLSLLMFVYLVPPENSILYLLSYVPLGLSVLAVFRFAEPAGARAAQNQWRSVRLLDTHAEDEDLDRRVLYLVQDKWTNRWLYLFLFMVVEILPVLVLAESSLVITVEAILILGIFAFYVYRSFHILKRVQKVLV